MKIEPLYEVFSANPSVGTDTRKDPKGTVFFCLKGPQFDANKFAAQALDLRAAHVVTSNKDLLGHAKVTVVEDVLITLQLLAKYHRSQFTFPVIGLTGSNGKTTNKELISAVLSRKYKTFFTHGNLNNHIGVPLTLLSIPLHAEMAVIEMGANHQREIAELSEICLPDFGMITNIGKAHIEGFGGLEGIKKGKKELFDHIEQNGGKVFVNGDDPVLMGLSTNLERFVFGSSLDYNVSGQLIENDIYVGFRYGYKDFQSTDIRTHLVGGYNLSNLMAAAAIGCYFEVDHKDIREALENYQPGNSRSQLVQTNKNKVILDAYNANPSSMELAINNLKEINSSNKLALIGHMLEMGEESDKEHQAIVDLLKKSKLAAILVGENFRAINLRGYSLFENSEMLRDWLRRNPVSDHLVLVKGSRMAAMEKCLESL